MLGEVMTRCGSEVNSKSIFMGFSKYLLKCFKYNLLGVYIHVRIIIHSYSVDANQWTGVHMFIHTLLYM